MNVITFVRKMALIQCNSVAAILPPHRAVAGMCRVLTLKLTIVSAVREVAVNELNRAADVLPGGAERGVVII